jgi:intracellular sulfur oxidation DsrE/DsrF family protein
MIRIRNALAALGAALALGLALHAHAAPDAREHVVIQVSDGDTKTWNQALNVVKNLQKAYKGNIDVEVVAFGNGIGMLKMDSDVGNRIDETVGSGAKVVACQNTMHGRHLKPEDMLSKIGYVPSGVVELVKKQKEGWSVIRP